MEDGGWRMEDGEWLGRVAGAGATRSPGGEAHQRRASYLYRVAVVMPCLRASPTGLIESRLLRRQISFVCVSGCSPPGLRFAPAPATQACLARVDFLNWSEYPVGFPWAISRLARSRPKRTSCLIPRED